LYALQQIEPRSIVYNIPQAVYVPAEWSETEIAVAFRRLIERHESLRTSFVMVDGEVRQRIHETVEFTLETYDTSAQSADPATVFRSFVRPFDLGRAPLLRAGLIRGGAEHVLMVDVHHIVSDRRSQEVLVHDFLRLCSGAKPPPLRLQYKDYCEWLQSPAQQQVRRRQEEYWLRRFSGTVPRLHLPRDFQAGDGPDSAGAVVRFRLEEELPALRELALAEGVTLQMLLLAVFYLLLAKVSGQEEMVVGTPVAGRRHPELEGIVGVFINTLPLRACPHPDKTFREFLAEVRVVSLEAYENQEYPLEDLMQKTVRRQRENAQQSLFEVLFEIRAFTGAREGAPGRPLPYVRLERATTMAAIDWLGLEGRDGIDFHIAYRTAMFQRETIVALTEKYRQLLRGVLAAVDSRIAELDYGPAVTVAREESDIEFNF